MPWCCAACAMVNPKHFFSILKKYHNGAWVLGIMNLWSSMDMTDLWDDNKIDIMPSPPPPPPWCHHWCKLYYSCILVRPIVSQKLDASRSFSQGGVFQSISQSKHAAGEQLPCGVSHCLAVDKGDAIKRLPIHSCPCVRYGPRDFIDTGDLTIIIYFQKNRL